MNKIMTFGQKILAIAIGCPCGDIVAHQKKKIHEGTDQPAITNPLPRHLRQSRDEFDGSSPEPWQSGQVTIGLDGSGT